MRRLIDAMERQGFVRRPAVVVAPREHLMAGVLELPPRRTGAPLPELARMEVAQSNRCDAQGFELALWELPTPARAADTTHVMTAACRHEPAEALLDAIEDAGVMVGALDAHAWAAARACGAMTHDDGNGHNAQGEGLTAVLDLGHGSSLLVLVHRGVVIYERALSSPGAGGLAGLRQTLAQRLNLEEQAVDYVLCEIGLCEEASLNEADRELACESRKWITAHVDGLLPELRASLSYAQHQYPDAPVDRVIVMGGGAAVPGVAQWMTAALEAPVQVATPASAVACGAALMQVGSQPAMTLAMGLAMHGEAA